MPQTIEQALAGLPGCNLIGAGGDWAMNPLTGCEFQALTSNVLARLVYRSCCLTLSERVTDICGISDEWSKLRRVLFYFYCQWHLLQFHTRPV